MTTAALHGATGAAIAATVRGEILAGVYAPGERIRQEDLAERHAASRLPVREALRMLEAEGLVNLVANTGAWVSRISMLECQEMYSMRERLEPLLLGMNVPHIPNSEADRLESLVSAMEGCTEVEAFLRFDRDFHLSSLQSVETSVLGATVLNLWNRTQRYRRAATRLFYQVGDHSVHHDHHLIVNAIRLGDAEEAELVLARHIRRSRIELSRHAEVFQ